EALRALGVRVGLDGVGSDYASVEHVHELPVDAVKVDMRIAARADAIRESVVATVEAARERGLTVTAKRAQHPKRMAEDPEEQQLFDEVRPDFVQSYAYGEPGPPAAIWKALAAFGAGAQPPRPPQLSPVPAAKTAEATATDVDLPATPVEVPAPTVALPEAAPATPTGPATP